jgi:hypothetical protein
MWRERSIDRPALGVPARLANVRATSGLKWLCHDDSQLRFETRRIVKNLPDGVRKPALDGMRHHCPLNLAGFSRSGSDSTVPGIIPKSGTGLAERSPEASSPRQKHAGEHVTDVTEKPEPFMTVRRSISKPLIAARCAAGLVAVSLLLGTAPAPAGEVPIFLGAIGVGKAEPEVQSQMRSLLREELSSADFAQLKTRERYTLSATLLRLDSVQSTDLVRATCVVSVALLRDNGTTLYALIHGRATAEETKTRSEVAQSDALRAAVHSAMVRVPKALR